MSPCLNTISNNIEMERARNGLFYMMHYEGDKHNTWVPASGGLCCIWRLMDGPFSHPLRLWMAGNGHPRSITKPTPMLVKPMPISVYQCLSMFVMYPTYPNVSMSSPAILVLRFQVSVQLSGLHGGLRSSSSAWFPDSWCHFCLADFFLFQWLSNRFLISAQWNVTLHLYGSAIPGLSLILVYCSYHYTATN